MPADNTLAETLGNLGQSLGNAFNPMNQIRANTMLQEMQQRQFELQRQQNIDAANRNAADVYERANPHNLPPADLAATAAQIRNGNYNPTGTIDALKAAGNYQAAQAAAGMIDAAHPEWSPGQRASAKSDILSGRKSLSEVETDFANDALTTNKASTTLDATNQARDAGKSANAPANASLAAGAAASGQFDTAGKIIAQGKTLDAASSLPADTSITSPLVSQLNTEQGIAGVPQTLPAQLQPQAATADITKKTLETQAAPRQPSAIVPTVAPTNPITNQPAAPGEQGAFGQKGQGPDTAATAATTSAEAGAKASTDIRIKDVNDDIAGLDSGQSLLRYIGLMRQAAEQLSNDTPLDQIKSQFLNRMFNEFGVTLTPGQSAREAFDAIAKQLIAASRKDSGVQRMAGPEINYLERALPTAMQDRASLIKGMDALETKARLGILTGKRAMEVLGKSQDGTINQQDYVDYLKARAALNAPPTQDQPPGSTPPRSDTELPGSHPAPPPRGGIRIFRPDGTLLQ